jgi:hypothetical protein
MLEFAGLFVKETLEGEYFPLSNKPVLERIGRVSLCLSHF